MKECTAPYAPWGEHKHLQIDVLFHQRVGFIMQLDIITIINLYIYFYLKGLKLSRLIDFGTFWAEIITPPKK